MFHTGLVSISFRSLTPEQIVDYMQEAGLRYVEWGSDVHAKKEDLETLHRIAALQQKNGIYCSSYGTYFHLGRDPLSDLPAYISAAQILGTNILRLWCGNKKSTEYMPEEKTAFLEQCRAAARIAEEHGVIFCMECHNNTYTQLLEGALELMEAVNSPAFRMYWQPNQFNSVAENIDYAKRIAEYTVHIHAFKWVGSNKYPLAEGTADWTEYLKAFEGNGAYHGEHGLLLEFMPDDRPESLKQEAATLKQLAGEE